MTDISSQLTAAIDQIPQMTERKKKIEMHVQIATKILSEIKRRSIDKLQDFEDELMTSGKVSAANRVEMFNFIKRETDKVEEFNDKLRLVLIYALCGSDINELKQLLEVLKSIHKDKYDEIIIEAMLKRRSDFESLTGSPQLSEQQVPQGSSSFIQGLARQVTSKSKSLLSNISGLLSEQKNLIHFNLVKKVIQNAQNRVASTSHSGHEQHFCDPKTGEKQQLYKGHLKQVIVFAAGGGSYYEYECMQRLERELGSVQIIYGSDNIFNPTDFIGELSNVYRK